MSRQTEESEAVSPLNTHSLVVLLEDMTIKLHAVMTDSIVYFTPDNSSSTPRWLALSATELRDEAVFSSAYRLPETEQAAIKKWLDHLHAPPLAVMQATSSDDARYDIVTGEDLSIGIPGTSLKRELGTVQRIKFIRTHKD